MSRKKSNRRNLLFNIFNLWLTETTNVLLKIYADAEGRLYFLI